MSPFIEPGSVVRRIWGRTDTVLFIFAGAAAEFALNKSVDWLYFTGKLPSDPLGRLFSTMGYSRRILFSSSAEAHHAIDAVRKIHEAVEQSRGLSIPDKAYRDVLFMLIHYSIASHELLEGRLTDKEKDEVFDVFFRIGTRMGIRDLPLTYGDWLPIRQAHLRDNLEKTAFTSDLFAQYRKHLGPLRYRVLVEGQKLVVPDRVKELLRYGNWSLLTPGVAVFKLCRLLKVDRWLRNLLVPSEYQSHLHQLDILPA
jgi:hypothetical protein